MSESYPSIEIELETHPETCNCPDLECNLCGIRDCPSSNDLHYHHDGCPDCDESQIIE